MIDPEITQKIKDLRAAVEAAKIAYTEALNSAGYRGEYYDTTEPDQTGYYLHPDFQAEGDKQARDSRFGIIDSSWIESLPEGAVFPEED